MAKQIINNGTVAGDGTGEILFDAFEKVNDNFTDLYNVSGWGVYQDAETTPATQTITTTPSKIQIDGAGADSNSDYLPREIRGVSELWDTINDKITPINVGDAYDVRIDLTVDSKTGAPTYIQFDLDIGGAASPTIIIVQRILGVAKTPPYSLSIGFPIFSLATFIANGGQLFVSTDVGTLTIGKRQIFIKRDYNGLT